ncbi:MAG: stage II sporulation protein R [Clostridia bacterium]|nr:stage II sporulation protein R [Clostridia bacterium]
MAHEARARAITCGLILAAMILAWAVAGARSAGARDEVTYAFNSSNLIRLHVVAPGNDGASQRLKLAVRDAVLTESWRAISGATSSRWAMRALSQNLGKIELAARDAVGRAGVDAPVAATLGMSRFPAAAYGRTAFPAGDYPALEVVIGLGAGANWWCVLFPPLCLVDLNRARILETDITLTGADRGLERGLPANGRIALEFAAGLWTAGPSTALLEWNLPAWVARLLRLPDFRQASK